MRPTWWRPAFGHGRGWLHDNRGDVLAALDPHALRARIHCAGLLGDPASLQQAQVITTTDAVWVARGEQLIRVDPGSAAWYEVPLPVTGDRSPVSTPGGRRLPMVSSAPTGLPVG